jgi:hypothetical protein
MIAAIAGLAFTACRAGTRAPKPDSGSLCLGYYVGFGQNTSSLLCREDSCFAVRHAGSEASPASVGYYAGAPGPGSYGMARDLAARAMAHGDWKMRAGAPAFRIALDDTLQRTISWLPENVKALQGLADWKEATMAALRSRPIWSDSLGLEADWKKDSVAVFLTSGRPATEWLGKSPDLLLLFGTKASRPDSQRTVGAECSRRLLSGDRCLQPIPKGTRWVKAIVRGAAQATLLGAGKACLDGRFELASGRVESARKP